MKYFLMFILLSAQPLLAFADFEHHALSVTGGEYDRNGKLKVAAHQCVYKVEPTVSSSNYGYYKSAYLLTDTKARFQIDIPVTKYPLQDGISFKTAGFTVTYTNGILVARKLDSEFGDDVIEMRLAVAPDLSVVTEASGLTTFGNIRSTDLDCKF
jgi:hypothetical protein